MGFHFNSDSDILIYKCVDIIDKEHIMDLYKHIAEESSYPRNLRTLIDAADCIFKFEIKDLPELFQGLEKAFEKYSSLREAIVVDKPYETVLATLFAEGFKDPNYKFKVFSTKYAALGWLK